jgi:hypothetical protein
MLFDKPTSKRALRMAREINLLVDPAPVPDHDGSEIHEALAWLRIFFLLGQLLRWPRLRKSRKDNLR